MNDPIVYTPKQSQFLAVPDAPLSYWLAQSVLDLMDCSDTVSSSADLVMGLSTADNDRFTRCFWETPEDERWIPFVKGGGYCKWRGLVWLVVDWEYAGARIKAYPKSAVRNESFYFRNGLTYTMAARGSLGVRLLDRGRIFEAKSPGVFMKPADEGLEFRAAGCG